MDFLPKIVYQDEHYLLCWKPHALASTWGQEDSFLDCIQLYGASDPLWNRQMAHFGVEEEYGLLNRLDTVTAGLLYMARDIESRDRYLQDQQNGCIKKIYYAKVYGTPRAGF